MRAAKAIGEVKREVKELYLNYRKFGDKFHAMLDHKEPTELETQEYLSMMEQTLLEIAQTVCEKTGEDWWK